MRMLLQVSIPVEKGNELVRKGTLGSTIQQILEDVKPEAAYFMEFDGKRTGVIIVDLATAADIPRVAEPFFLALNARIEMHAVMSPQDLAMAGPAIGAAAAKFGQ